MSGAYVITAAQLVAWDERPRAAPVGGTSRIVNSGWRSHSASEQMAFCYYDGTFTNLEHPGVPARGPAASPPPFDRIVVVVDSAGKPNLYTAGMSSSLQIQNPTKP